MKDEDYILRDGDHEDLGYLLCSWKSLRHSFVFDHAPEDHARQELEKVLRGVLADPAVRMRVACVPDEPRTILAMALFKDTCLYFVYVSQPVRRHGIARALCADAKIDSFAFSTHGFWRRLRPAVRGWTYLPRISWGAT